jgi:hypothetical protein
LTEYRTVASCHPVPTKPGIVKHGIWLSVPATPRPRQQAMTRSLRRIDWAALGANLGSTVLFTLLLLSPFLWGAHYRQWLAGLALGVILGVYFYLRRDRYREPGPDADETRFPH